ncbi:histidine phosphatase family protein [Brevibacillus nitrificans]|uniref:histidine phosphatase family protein n=1 Tax=Brevibacillus nitrificans TaxID=651560 RepID=UPI0026358848|nr:histidine phosphatase family protein [Brevibacillus nitrificans]MED1794887.1 histidine phosphatase family protein [Brevibacillus nitrificans]
MKHIYIVRHCQATGQEPDAPLTERGQQQAVQLASFFAETAVDSILSSPFERAYCTVSPLAEKLGLKIVTDERLTERVLTGQNHPNWREMLRQTYDDLDLCYEGGESSRGAMERASSVVREVLESEHTHTVIVSHGNLISLLLKHFDSRIGFPEWESLSNPDVYHLSFAGEQPGIERIWRE